MFSKLLSFITKSSLRLPLGAYITPRALRYSTIIAITATTSYMLYKYIPAAYANYSKFKYNNIYNNYIYRRLSAIISINQYDRNGNVKTTQQPDATFTPNDTCHKMTIDYTSGDRVEFTFNEFDVESRVYDQDRLNARVTIGFDNNVIKIHECYDKHGRDSLLKKSDRIVWAIGKVPGSCIYVYVKLYIPRDADCVTIPIKNPYSRISHANVLAITDKDDNPYPEALPIELSMVTYRVGEMAIYENFNPEIDAYPSGILVNMYRDNLQIPSYNKIY